MVMHKRFTGAASRPLYAWRYTHPLSSSDEYLAKISLKVTVSDHGADLLGARSSSSTVPVEAPPSAAGCAVAATGMVVVPGSGGIWTSVVPPKDMGLPEAAVVAVEGRRPPAAVEDALLGRFEVAGGSIRRRCWGRTSSDDEDAWTGRRRFVPADVVWFEPDLDAPPPDRDRVAAAKATDVALFDVGGPYGLVREEVDEFDMVKHRPSFMQLTIDFHVCSARPSFAHSKAT